MPPKEEKSLKWKHLTDEQRMEIQECLYHGMTFKAIGRRIEKDQTTVSKEVKGHIRIIPGKEVGEEICPWLLKAPFVCNGCQKRRYCKLEKHMYDAKTAQKEYRETLTDSRTGVTLNHQEFYDSDRLLSARIAQGQHLYHAVQAGGISFSLSSAYRHLHNGYLSVSLLDMPRVVKFKPRKTTRKVSIPKALKEGRTFDCFEQYCAENNVSFWVELDLVIGRPGGKVLMTFDFTFCNFMFGILLDNKASATIAAAFQALKTKLLEAGFFFGSIFPVILTDNGGEFSCVFAIENDCSGNKEASLFFCDPYSPFQKPRVEKNHTLLRDILPQGTSFDSLSQADVDLVFSHINSVMRKSLNGKSPFQMFSFTYGSRLADTLNIHFIPPDSVIQSPALLGR